MRYVLLSLCCVLLLATDASAQCPTCPPRVRATIRVPVTAVIVVPDEAKVTAALDKFSQGTLSKKEADDLKATVPARTIRKLMEQRWSLGTCAMICRSHGSQLYNIYDDGSKELASGEITPAGQQSESVGSVRDWWQNRPHILPRRR